MLIVTYVNNNVKLYPGQHGGRKISAVTSQEEYSGFNPQVNQRPFCVGFALCTCMDSGFLSQSKDMQIRSNGSFKLL